MIKIVCSDCGKIIDDLGTIKFTEEDKIICRTCANNKYRICSCGKYIPNKLSRYICVKCDDQVYTKTCNNYSTKPIPRFRNKIGNSNLKTRYYGLELEYNYLSPVGAKVIFKELYDDKLIYNKSDGSISSGVEIVTNPCDLYSIKKLIEKMGDGLEYISDNVNRYSYNAGCHIHVDRKSIDPIDICKLSLLLNLETSFNNKLFMYLLSNRITIRKSTFDDRYYRIGYYNDYKRLCKEGERHIALNINNSNTIEFRLFKSSADKDMLLSYIEIVNQLIEFCHCNGIRNININNFAVWLKYNCKNEIILKKIKSFERKYGKFEKTTNIYKIDMNEFKNIHVSKYNKVLDVLKSGKTISNTKILLDDIRNDRYKINDCMLLPSKKYESIFNKIEKTYRAYLMSSIMKLKERNEVCA